MSLLVVVSRDAARAAPLATRLAARGADVVALPCTRIVPPEAGTWRELCARVSVAADYDGVAVASANAADALIRAGAPAGLAVVAVGRATAAALTRAGLVAEVAGPDAAALADALVARGARRVLWPRAEAGRDEGLERLRAAGVAVDAPVAYRTVPAPADDPEVAAGLAALARADVLCVYAPSQVAALAALGAWPTRARVVAIGETTAAALRDRGVAVAGVAAAPDADAMAQAVAQVLPTPS